MNPLPDRIEAHCPRCNAAFVLSIPSSSKKVQCPKCRKTVAVGLVLSPPAVLPMPELFPPLKLVTDYEPAPVDLPPSVEAATEVLPPVDFETSRAPDDSLLRPGHKLRWLHRDERAWIGAHEDDEQQQVLLHNLLAMGRRAIDLAAFPDDLPGQRLAGHLSTIFRKAGWDVRETPSDLPVDRASGLVLAAGQCPLPRAATAVYMALKAAGFAVTTRLDGSFGPEESLLIAAGGSN